MGISTRTSEDIRPMQWPLGIPLSKPPASDDATDFFLKLGLTRKGGTEEQNEATLELIEAKKPSITKLTKNNLSIDLSSPLGQRLLHTQGSSLIPEESRREANNNDGVFEDDNSDDCLKNSNECHFDGSKTVRNRMQLRERKLNLERPKEALRKRIEQGLGDQRQHVYCFNKSQRELRRFVLEKGLTPLAYAHYLLCRRRQPRVTLVDHKYKVLKRAKVVVKPISLTKIIFRMQKFKPSKNTVHRSQKSKREEDEYKP